MSVLSVHIYVNHAHVWCLKRAEERIRIPRTEAWIVVSYIWKQTTEPGSSTRATGTLNHWAISTALPFYIRCVLSLESNWPTSALILKENELFPFQQLTITLRLGQNFLPKSPFLAEILTGWNWKRRGYMIKIQCMMFFKEN